MLSFTRKGLLVPYSKIATSVHELKHEFVDKIPNPERTRHFNAYTNYSNTLKHLCGDIDLIQWIDGSFVTQISIPNDIDVVTFIDSQIILSLGNALQSFKYPASEDIYQVDGYIVAVHPVLSEKYYQYEHDKAYWNDQFTKTRRNRAGKKLSKGFLEIVY